MREIKQEIKYEKVVYIEAYDGTRFYTGETDEGYNKAKKEAIEYEKTAKAVINKRVLEFKIADTSSYDLTDGEGCEDYQVEIFKPKTPEQIKDLQMYLESQGKSYSAEVLNDKYIDKEVMIWWNYDKDGYTFNTLETYVKSITDSYYKEIQKYAEKGKVK